MSNLPSRPWLPAFLSSSSGAPWPLLSSFRRTTRFSTHFTRTTTVTRGAPPLRLTLSPWVTWESAACPTWSPLCSPPRFSLLETPSSIAPPGVCMAFFFRGPCSKIPAEGQQVRRANLLLHSHLDLPSPALPAGRERNLHRSYVDHQPHYWWGPGIFYYRSHHLYSLQPRLPGRRFQPRQIALQRLVPALWCVVCPYLRASYHGLLWIPICRSVRC